MKNMIYTTVRKPSFMVKMALITVLFVVLLEEDLLITGYKTDYGFVYCCADRTGF